MEGNRREAECGWRICTSSVKPTGTGVNSGAGGNPATAGKPDCCFLSRGDRAFRSGTARPHPGRVRTVSVRFFSAAADADRTECLHLSL
jgi:hypothetical protein